MSAVLLTFAVLTFAVLIVTILLLVWIDKAPRTGSHPRPMPGDRWSHHDHYLNRGRS